MNALKNHYDILGVSQESSEEEIKRAYRKLAQVYHPDAQSESTEQFLEVSKAYRTLRDKKLRITYDKNLKHKKTSENRSLIDLSVNKHTFKNILRKVSQYYKKLGKEKCEFEISALESIRGSTRELIIQNGLREYTLKVKIPSGVRGGQKLRISHPNFPKQILIKLKIRPHPFVERNKNDIILKVPITREDALFGAELIIPTPNGKSAVYLPKNWPKNKLFKVPASGFTLKTGKKADIYIKPVIVKFSQNILKQKRELLSYS